MSDRQVTVCLHEMRKRRHIVLFFPIGLLFWFCVSYVQFESKLTGTDDAHDDMPSKEERASNPKTILFWTRFFGGKNSYLGEEGKRLEICEVSECILTDDTTLWNTSDALIFHPLDIDFSAPDLFVPPRRFPHQYYIYFVLESPHHAPSGGAATAGFFNLTFTYRFDSDIIADNYLQYFRLPQWTTTTEMDVVWKKKKKLVAMFASNCGPPSDRQTYVKMLQKYIPVDVFGSCGDIECPKESKEACDGLIGDYKFYLAFENSICLDYITEKAIRPYVHNTIPVFLGGANYSTVFPADSFVNALDYESPKDLAMHLLHVASSKTAYASYFKFRYMKPSNPHNNLPPHLAPDNVSLCKLCSMLHSKHRIEKVYWDMESWWATGGKCKMPQWDAQKPLIVN